MVVTNQATLETEVIAAGQALLGRACSSSWNPEFWINFVGVAKEVLLYLAESQGGSAFPTEERVEAFVDELTGLIGTPFNNTSGECDTEHLANVLVDGTGSTVLRPNEPIKISLFSAYYARVRGFGSWRAEASVASDYYLVGVVESANTDDEECCADMYGSYVVGSLSRPANGGIYNDAVNSINDRLRQVGFFLSEFGDWNGLTTNPNTGQVQIKGEYGLLSGPSCQKRYIGGLGKLPSKEVEPPRDTRFYVFPGVTSAGAQVTFLEATDASSFLVVSDNMGREMYRQSAALLDKGQTLELDFSRYAAGQYWISLRSTSSVESKRITKF